jgi:hypothetical protein
MAAPKDMTTRDISGTYVLVRALAANNACSPPALISFA